MHALLWVLSQSTLFLVLRKIKRILEIDLKLEKNLLFFSWSLNLQPCLHVSHLHTEKVNIRLGLWLSNEQGKGKSAGEPG